MSLWIKGVLGEVYRNAPEVVTWLHKTVVLPHMSQSERQEVAPQKHPRWGRAERDGVPIDRRPTLKLVGGYPWTMPPALPARPWMPARPPPGITAAPTTCTGLYGQPRRSASPSGATVPSVRRVGVPTRAPWLLLWRWRRSRHPARSRRGSWGVRRLSCRATSRTAA